MYGLKSPVAHPCANSSNTRKAISATLSSILKLNYIHREFLQVEDQSHGHRGGRSIMHRSSILLLTLALLSGCSNDSNQSCGPASSGQSIVLSQQQRTIADQIISVFENDTPKLQYGYADNINDG